MTSEGKRRFYAHSSEKDEQFWQTAADHANGVAAIAEILGKRIGIGQAVRLAGLLHDLGKYTLPFQGVLHGSNERVDHSTAGAAAVRQLLGSGSPNDRIIGELIAYCIAGHHAGLPDGQGEGRSLAARLGANGFAPPDPIWREELAPDLSDLMPVLPRLQPRQVAGATRPEAAALQAMFAAKVGFQYALLGRMIFSVLVDADRRDTEAWYAAVANYEIDRHWPALGEVLPGILARYDAYMAAKPRTDSPVNALRADILAAVRRGAERPPGLFTLTVPTGGGKTLASLGFALDHARRHGLDRIIVAIPFTSVVDQTAAVFGEVIGKDLILEHHSGMDDDSRPREGGADDVGAARLRRAMEDWAAPIVVTTNVQLFESLFAARTSRARKVHNIARSVIILDEAQTLPRELLIPTIWMIEALVRDWGCSIVLCTATQPALHRFAPGHPAALDIPTTELAPDPARLAAALKRVTLHYGGVMDDASLVAALGATAQGLVIVNSRRHALELYRAAEAAGLEGLFHLSTRQVAFDRRAQLAEIRAWLQARQPCRVIATSLVEAGVDLDFPRVWRAEAGLDQIAQAAGRCNREGRRPVEDSIVTVFVAADHKPAYALRALAEAATDVLRENADFLAPEVMERYFHEVYWRMGVEHLDRGRAEKTPLPLRDRFRISQGLPSFAYRSVAENYRMIDSGMVPVIVPRDDISAAALRDLANPAISSGALARRLQSYVVQVPPKSRDRLLNAGHVRFELPELREEQFAVLQSGDRYNPRVGLNWDDPEYLSTEGLFI